MIDCLHGQQLKYEDLLRIHHFAGHQQMPIKTCQLILNPPLLQHPERSSGTMQMKLVRLSRPRLDHDVGMDQQFLQRGLATGECLLES
jgi:hypothetical protein